MANTRRLKLLLILTHADARATGPSVWTPWKAALVTELYVKTLNALQQGSTPARRDTSARLGQLERYDPLVAASVGHLLDRLPEAYLETEVDVMADELRMLATRPRPDEVAMTIARVGESDAVTFCLVDSAGALARGAGVLSLHRIDVLSARVFTSSDGYALQRFLVHLPDEFNERSLLADARAAASGRVAVGVRIARKINAHHRGIVVSPEVRVVTTPTDGTTVLEVRAPNVIGLLHVITAALAEVGADIYLAKIDTIGDRVVDVFYLRSAAGEPLDAEQVEAARAAIAHRSAVLSDRP